MHKTTVCKVLSRFQHGKNTNTFKTTFKILIEMLAYLLCAHANILSCKPIDHVILCLVSYVLFCQPRVEVTLCFVYKVMGLYFHDRIIHI